MWLGPAASLSVIIVVATISVFTKTNHPTKDTNKQDANKQAEQELGRLLDEINERRDSGASEEAVHEFTAGEAVDPVTDETDPLSIPVGTIAFYEGNRGSGRMLGQIVDYGGQRINLVEDHESLDNDKARSCVLYNVRIGAVISIFDNPSGDRSDDWIVITIKKPHPRYTISTFESDIDDDYVQVKRMKKHRLDGRVSRIEVD